MYTMTKILTHFKNIVKITKVLLAVIWMTYIGITYRKLRNKMQFLPYCSYLGCSALLCSQTILSVKYSLNIPFHQGSTVNTLLSKLKGNEMYLPCNTDHDATSVLGSTTIFLLFHLLFPALAGLQEHVM